MRIGQEAWEMIFIFDWIRLNRLDGFIFHIANERKTSPQSGAFLKKMGVKAGVSDIFVAKPSSGFNGLFIEVKAQRGRLTGSQYAFLETMRSHGYDAVICFGGQAAIEKIAHYLNPFYPKLITDDKSC